MNSNMTLAATGARGVMALLVRRPSHLDDLSLDELRLVHRTLSTLVGTIDAAIESRSATPTDMANLGESEGRIDDDPPTHNRWDPHCVDAFGGHRQRETARCRTCWPRGTHPAERAAQDGTQDEPPEITGHPFSICICTRCGPPWRTSRPWSEGDWATNASWMSLCPRCGSKRCPGAIDHRNACGAEEEARAWPMTS